MASDRAKRFIIHPNSISRSHKNNRREERKVNMTKLMDIAALFLFALLLVSTAKAHTVVDVTKHGAKDGCSDIKEALASAWKEACASTSPSKILIPEGTFSLGPLTMEGPCKAAVQVEVKATVKALTENLRDGSWVKFQHIEGFKLFGGGTFDGQGTKTWGACSSYCKQLPINLRFDFITDGLVQDITSLNSKQFHVNLLGCKNFTFNSFTVTAPDNSPNTDGIHIGRSTGINITNSVIGTGDDCISIGDGSKQVSITKVSCGPGHGISVGSLGKYENEEPVEGITVNDCTFNNTENGVRIKTWPASYAGTASDMHFENIKMVNVCTPILIDQVYCPSNQCNAKLPSKIKLSKISFKNIEGTSSGPVPLKLSCSSGLPCEDVEISDIDITYNGKEGAAKSECSYVKPKISGKINPPACTSPATTPLDKSA